MAVAVEKRTAPFGPGTVILVLLSLFGIVLTVYRWAVGLGPTTALTDGRGWGIWIGFDVVSGIALAAGAFTIAATVYIFQLKRFYPIVRATVLTGFIGYGLAAVAISIDLGFPYRIFNLVRFSNIHSPLYEIGWCVMAYATVLALESSPLIFERFNMKAPLRLIRAITIPLVILGVILSTMHQSTLGTLFLPMPHRIPALWYSGILPLLFFVSAVGLGLGMVIVESTLSSYAFKRSLEGDLMADIAKVIPYVLGLYLLLKVVDLVVAGDVGAAFSGGLNTILFWVEMIIGVILPIIFFSMESVRNDRYKRFWTAVLVVVGIVFNRLMISVIAFDAGPYVPSWQELFITIGWVSVGVMAFYLAGRFLPLFPEEH